MKRKGEFRLPVQHLRASIESETFNAEARTVEIRWYTGAAVLRHSFFDGPYMLQFSMDPKAVRLERFQSGRAAFKAGHGFTDEIRDVLGVLENPRLAEDGGRATVRFSKRPEVDSILQDVRDGILGNVSMEARAYEVADVTEKGDEMTKLLATDWEPTAVALVGTGADPGAQVLADGAAKDFPCTIHLRAEAVADAHGGETMKVRLLSTNEVVEIAEEEFDEKLHSKELEAPKASDPDPPAAQLDDKAEDRKLADFKEAEARRHARIRELQVHFEEDELWSQRHIKLGSSVDVAKADGMKRAAKKAPDIDGRLSVGSDYESIGWKSARIVEALSARSLGETCPDPAKKWERATVAECAYVLLEQRGETRGRMLDPLRGPEDVIKLAMTTSDFPGVLANVLNKTLLPAYVAAAPSFQAIAARRNFRDYRAHKFVRIGDFPETKLVGEGGEVTEGSIGEGSETVTALKYGRILNLALEVLVNDDVGAFQDFGGLVARRIRDRERALFYATCITAGSGLGPDLADGVAVHNAAHGNVNSAGALSNDRLNEAFGLMAAQVGLSGDAADAEIKLDVMPRYVLTSATSHVLARTLLTAVNPTQASEVNPWAGIIEPIYDSNLSGVRYYVIADPMALPNYIYGTVDSQGPRFEVRQGFEVEGVQVKAVHDFGCGAIDYRGSVSGAGS